MYIKYPVSTPNKREKISGATELAHCTHLSRNPLHKLSDSRNRPGLLIGQSSTEAVL